MQRLLFSCVYTNNLDTEVDWEGTHTAMIEHNHTLRLLAGGRRRGIHFGGNSHRLLLIPEVVFAEYEVAQMLRQPCGLEYFNLKRKKAPLVWPADSKEYLTQRLGGGRVLSRLCHQTCTHLRTMSFSVGPGLVYGPDTGWRQPDIKVGAGQHLEADKSIWILVCQDVGYHHHHFHKKVLETNITQHFIRKAQRCLAQLANVWVNEQQIFRKWQGFTQLSPV